MAGAIQALKISELVNYYENPRHAIGSSEEDTLKKLFDAVGIQYMLNLAEDVQRNGLLGNQQIVVVYSETIHKYVVYEGNRRVAAIKLLLAPEHFGFLDRAILMETGINSDRKEWQQRVLPQIPMPPMIFVSSRTPTWRSSILVRNTLAKSFTSSRKSILPSAVK